MLLRSRPLETRFLLAAGQLALATAIICQLVVHPAGDFWRGFTAGFCGVLFGFSLVLNLTALVRLRRQGG